MKLLPALSILAVSAALAQAPIEELPSAGNSRAAQPLSQPQAQMNADTYYQMQILQEEVRTLRGVVEELQYELERLKQRQLDDYMDLDRRLSNGVTGTSGADSAADTSAQTDTAGTNVAPAKRASAASAGGDEEAAKNDYVAAYNLLRERKVDESLSAFENHVATYPNSAYLPNAFYWMGEINLTKKDLERARQAFTQVVKTYPDSQKFTDAAYGLGKTLHMQGNRDQAEQWLRVVADGKSSTAVKAQRYLENEFRQDAP